VINSSALGVRNFAETLVSEPVYVNSLTGAAPWGRLDELMGTWITDSGTAPLEVVRGVFGGCDLIGSPTIRDDGLGYAVKPNGRPYGRRRMQQWMAEADFFIWRQGIPATMVSSWHAYLDGRMEQARDGALARTGHSSVGSAAIHRAA
jgi:hypothetical protein